MCETPLVSTPSTTVIDSLDAFEKYVSHRVGRKVKRDSLDNQLQMDPLVKLTSGTILWKNFRRRGRKNGAMSLSGDKIVHPREGELG